MGEKSRTGWGVLVNVCPTCGVVHKGVSRYCSKHLGDNPETRITVTITDKSILGLAKIIADGFLTERNQL